MTNSEITIEKFSLKFGKYNACDIPFTAKLGNQTIKSYISNWSVNFDLIRHQLERLTFYPQNGEIDICFEDDPTKFVFKHRFLRKKLPDGSINFSSVMYLQIVPNCFTHAKTIEGYCNPEQVIGAMYEAFLLLGRTFVTSKQFNFDDWHFTSGLNIYNTLKSGIVETFLLTTEPEELIKRQTIVGHIVTIRAGKNNCGYLENGAPICISGHDIIRIKVFECILIDGIQKWLNQKMQPNLDFEKWNQQGFKIAKQIRLSLPDEYDVWYQSSNKKLSLIL